MNREALATYLNDHKAGSVGAVELLEHLISKDGDGSPLVGILAGLRESQVILERLFDLLALSPDPLKRAGAWVAEKLVRLKIGGQTQSGLERFEALEMVALGIQGQECLWRALQVIASGEPRLKQIDLVHLERRARALHGQVERLRLDAAFTAFMS